MESEEASLQTEVVDRFTLKNVFTYLEFFKLLLKLNTHGLLILNLAMELAVFKVFPLKHNKTHVNTCSCREVVEFVDS